MESNVTKLNRQPTPAVNGPRDKVRTLDELGRITDQARAGGKVVVQAHGTFDLLHLGHIRHLEAARKLGDILVVTVTADRFVNKGPGRPVFSAEMRAEMLASLEYVDWVSINDAADAVNTIEKIRPSIYIKGQDYQNPQGDVTGKITLERDTVEAHAADLPPQFNERVVQSGAYVEEVERSLLPPQPHRNHPYWLGAMAAHKWSVAQRERAAMPLTAADLLELQATGLTWWLYQIRNFIFGRPPRVRPWHPRWPDYRMFLKLARQHFAGKKGKLLVLSSAPAAFANFLSEISSSSVSLDLNFFLTMTRKQYEPMMGSFEGCLVVIGEGQIGRMHELLRRIKPIFRESGTILVFAINGYGAHEATRIRPRGCSAVHRLCVSHAANRCPA